MEASHDIQVLFNADLASRTNMAHLIEVCAHALDADVDNRLVAPPRHSVDFATGRLVFTTGGLDDVVGFRAYDTFPRSRQDQVVAVWDRSTRTLIGIVIGDQLGALRTGAIGGVAVDRLAPPDAATCAVIGTGRQARTQLAACNAVRPLRHVTVFSRSADSRRQFADEMTVALDLDVQPVSDAPSAVGDADIILIATSSSEPVVDHRDMKPDVHVNTVGPKSTSAHEISTTVAEGATRIVTDSPQQIEAQGQDHFLSDSPALARVEHLGRLKQTAHRSGRSVFLSTGLAGTEVLVAEAILRAHTST